jgi:hypothetical protein
MTSGPFPVRIKVSSAFAPVIEGIPGEGLSGVYLLRRLFARDDLTGGVACHAALVMQPPLFGETGFGIEGLAVCEGVGKGTAGDG